MSKFRGHLKHKATVYDRLRIIQGRYIPFHLGSIDLVHPYSYDRAAYLKHMMLLSPGGLPLGIALSKMDCDHLISKIKESLSAIHALGIVHRDPAPRNWSYNEETESVVFFDFERAGTINQRPTLGIISPNRKRGRTNADPKTKRPKSEFTEDINRAVNELRSSCPRVLNIDHV